MNFDLQRFLDAQADVYEDVLRELRSGQKQTHWMWFMFPQIHGLGHSAMAQRYAIASLEEAKAYLSHQVLGYRLRECTRAINAIEHRTISAILGSPDDVKFRSSLTLFCQAAEPNDRDFNEALRKYFNGESDPRTASALS
jgi:uncharacterized protein (DUF1810 family)